MIKLIYHVFRIVWIICSGIKGEIFIYLENKDSNFKLSTQVIPMHNL